MRERFTNNENMRNYRDRNQTHFAQALKVSIPNSIAFVALLTVGVRDVGPEHVVLAVHHLVHLFAVPQQFEVHETRLVPGKEARKDGT